MSPRQRAGHGTRACYLRGCRLQACCDAHNSWCKAYRASTYRGGPRRIDSAPAVAHCRELAAQGWSNHQIGAAAECDDTFVAHLLRGLAATIDPQRSARILKARPEAVGVPKRGYADATGTRRRGQALMVMGHTLKSIAAAIGIDADRLGQIVNGPRTTIRTSTAERMAAVYVRLSRTAGTFGRTRDLAVARGWVGPMAWGDDIDDPDAMPEPEPEADPSDCSQIDEVLHLARFGITPEEIAARTGLSTGHIKTQIKKARTTALTLTA